LRFLPLTLTPVCRTGRLSRKGRGDFNDGYELLYSPPLMGGDEGEGEKRKVFSNERR